MFFAASIMNLKDNVDLYEGEFEEIQATLSPCIINIAIDRKIQGSVMCAKDCASKWFNRVKSCDALPTDVDDSDSLSFADHMVQDPSDVTLRCSTPD